MRQYRKQRVPRALAAATLLVIGPALAEPPAVVGYELQSSRRVGRTLSEFTYRLRVNSTDGYWRDVRFVATSSAPATTILDGLVTVPSIDATGVLVTSDTFRIRQDRRVKFSPAALSWEFAGQAYTPVSVPNAWLALRALEDSEGENPTPGASVIINGNYYGATDANGVFAGRVPVGDRVQVQVIDRGVVGALREIELGEGDTVSLDLVLKSESGLNEPASLTIHATPGPGITVQVQSLAITVSRDPRPDPIRLSDNLIIQVHYDDGDTPELVTALFSFDTNGRLVLQRAADLRMLLTGARVPVELSVYGEDQRGRIFDVSAPIGP